MTRSSRTYTHVIQRYFPFRGGSERYFQAFSERFAAAGERVHIVTTDAWDLEYFWDPRRDRVGERRDCHNGVEIHRVPVRHLPAASLTHRAIRRMMAESSRLSFTARNTTLQAGSRFGPWLPALFDEMQRLPKPDLINSANIAFESMIGTAGRYARKHDVPHLVTPFMHLGESADSKVRRYYTMPHQIQLLHQADGVLVLTELEAEYLLAAGVQEESVHVVGAGIDVDSVTGGDGRMARARLGIDGPIVLTLGAAAYDKGTVHLIEAARQLSAYGDDIHLIIAGPVMSEVRRLIDALDARDLVRIHLLGFVTDEERRDLLAAADMVALPSRTESFGLVFMEAWANGKPVIGARAGAIPSVVTDGEDGLLVEFGDVPGLVGAVRDIVRNSANSAHMGERGRAKVVTEDQWFERVWSVYEHVLGYGKEC